MENQQASFKLSHEMRVKITAVIDTSLGQLLTHGKNALELELMFNFGLSPMESIIASTKSASIALSLQTEIGIIEKGKLVDLIIVKAILSNK